MNWKEFLKKFTIKNKRDWIVFWIFAGILCYGFGSYNSTEINSSLLRFADIYMTQLNVPSVWGQLLAAGLLLFLVIEAVLFFCRKPVKAKVLVLAAALLLPTITVFGYHLHTKLIASSFWKEEPRSVILWQDGEHRDDLTKEEQQQILLLCRSMTVVTDEAEQKQLMEWYKTADNPFMGAAQIDLYFPEKYGHNYQFNLRLYQGKVYLWRGYAGQEEQITFFEDNGITEWFQGVMEKE